MQGSTAPPSDSFEERFRTYLRERPFLPHPLLSSPHLQTLAASLWRRKFPWGWDQSSTRDLHLRDGMRVRVECILQGNPAPTLIALHGMGGSSRSTYMQGLSHKAHRLGWNSILLNLYDTNLDSDPPRIFHSGSSSRIGEVVRLLSQWESVQSLFLFGVSMSGNMLLKLMAESASSSLPAVRAAAVLSPLCDLTSSWQTLEKPSNSLYRVHYLKGLKEIVRRKSRYLSDYVDLPSLMRVRTIRQFDELFTAPLGGFEDAFDYYRKASSAPLLPKIRVPTLILHSRDDPFLPWTPLDRPEVRSNHSLLVHLTDRGGHVGFIEQTRRDIDRAWAENRVIDFFAMAERYGRKRGKQP